MAKSKSKQSYIPGTEPPSIPEIDAAAEEYVRHRDRRMAALIEEIGASKTLLELLIKHNLRSYDYEGKTVRINDIRKVSVKKIKAKKPRKVKEGV